MADNTLTILSPKHTLTHADWLVLLWVILIGLVKTPSRTYAKRSLSQISTSVFKYTCLNMCRGAWMIAWGDVHISGCEGVMIELVGERAVPRCNVCWYVYVPCIQLLESLLWYQLCDGDCLDYGIWRVRSFHEPEQHRVFQPDVSTNQHYSLT